MYVCQAALSVSLKDIIVDFLQVFPDKKEAAAVTLLSVAWNKRNTHFSLLFMLYLFGCYDGCLSYSILSKLIIQYVYFCDVLKLPSVAWNKRDAYSRLLYVLYLSACHGGCLFHSRLILLSLFPFNHLLFNMFTFVHQWLGIRGIPILVCFICCIYLLVMAVVYFIRR